MTPAADGVESDCERDELFMRRALELGESVRLRTSPNPWVGSVVVGSDGSPVGEGATAPPGGAHAEVAALRAAGGRASGSTLYTTLEPCAHHGRTPSCAEAIVQAGVARVVASVIDPDGHVNGRGMARLRAARVRVTTGVLEEKVESLLAPYLKHRRSGRPYVVLKLAATADGRIAARDGSSKWITGPEARADVQLLRRESDAVLVGARTIRMDDPMLTVRGRPGAGAGRPDEAGGQGGGAAERSGEATGQYAQAGRELLRVVLGRLPKDGARAAPALELSGDLRGVLD
ncbi:MAG: bifunctional diaminohydroxyphosphoribosylaminopyrimidine deaminase/5-amino-6-(5-phosphoribosylamino)uracil reductase RibD, partial [Acidimicrobiales bacterium]